MKKLINLYLHVCKFVSDGTYLISDCANHACCILELMCSVSFIAVLISEWFQFPCHLLTDYHDYEIKF